jgi:hypothetical protein
MESAVAGQWAAVEQMTDVGGKGGGACGGKGSEQASGTPVEDLALQGWAADVWARDAQAEKDRRTSSGSNSAWGPDAGGKSGGACGGKGGGACGIPVEDWAAQGWAQNAWAPQSWAQNAWATQGWAVFDGQNAWATQQWEQPKKKRKRGKGESAWR